jgi:hypothetical protein
MPGENKGIDLKKISDVTGIAFKTDFTADPPPAEPAPNDPPPANPPAADPPPAEPEKKDAPPEENKTIQIGGKWYTDAEIDTMCNEHFKTDISKMPEETKKVYVETFINAKNGMNKEAWQKAQGRRDQELKAKKDQLLTLANDLKTKEADLARRETALKNEILNLQAIANEDLTDAKYDDLSALEMNRKVFKQEEAKKRIAEIKKVDNAQIEEENNKIERERKNYEFNRDLNTLSITYPELELEDTFQNIITDFNNGKRTEEDLQVKKAFGLFKLLNDAADVGLEPVKYYRLYKDSYPEFHAKGKQLTADEIAAKEKAEKIKKEQEKNPPPPPSGGGTPGDPASQKTGDLIKGKTFNEKFNSILKGK